MDNSTYFYFIHGAQGKLSACKCRTENLAFMKATTTTTITTNPGVQINK